MTNAKEENSATDLTGTEVTLVRILRKGKAMYIPDNLDLFEQQDIERERKRARLPKCCECGETVQDEECYYIFGKVICEHCMEEFKVLTEDLVKE